MELVEQKCLGVIIHESVITYKIYKDKGKSGLITLYHRKERC